jgi:uncharacterized protein YqhQ
MGKKAQIGGRAYGNGVKLMNSQHSVKAYYDQNNNIKYKKEKVKSNKYFKLIKKIPVIRGIFSLLFAIGMFLKEGIKKPKKYWVIFVILFFDIIYFYFSGYGGTTGRVINILYLSLPVILIIIFHKTIGEILKFHGAEHKVVHYYENDQQGNIQDYSRLHRRCGSNIVFYYLIISIGSGFINFNVDYYLSSLLYLGVAYEAIRYTPEWLLFIPQLFQRLVTSEPESRHVKAAETALDVLTGRN